MKYFIYQCEDIEERERAQRLRRELLQAHLDYVESRLSAYAVAGPNRGRDGAYHSSTFIIQAGSREAADAVMEGDPYVRAGLYQPLSVVELLPVVGAWVGGVRWRDPS